MKKTNNQGFSLVEVLIAMAILVIVSIPIIVTMSDSVKLNAASKGEQKAVSIEESITERLGTYNIPEVIDQFQKTDTTKFDIVKEFTSYKQLNESYEPTTYNIKESKDKYYFGIYGIKEGVKEYDALITYKNARSDSKVAKVEEINSKDVKTIIPVPTDTNIKKDTLYVVNNLLDGTTAYSQDITINIYKNKAKVDLSLKKDSTSTAKTDSQVVDFTSELKNLLVYVTPVSSDADKNTVHINIADDGGAWAKRKDGSNSLKREHNIAFRKVNNTGEFKAYIGPTIPWKNYDIAVTTDDETKDTCTIDEASGTNPLKLETHITNANAELGDNAKYAIYWADYLKKINGSASNRMYEVVVDIYDHKDSQDFAGKKISSMTSTITN